ncbi:MAG: trehalose-6-phosphate synthase [Acidimicrobiia bacterium]
MTTHKLGIQDLGVHNTASPSEAAPSAPVKSMPTRHLDVDTIESLWSAGWGAGPTTKQHTPSATGEQGGIQVGAADAASRSDLVVVANRLPVRRIGDDENTVWETSPGGLVSALLPTLAGRSVTWIGWTGDVLSPEREPLAPFEHDGMLLEPIELDDAEVRGFYDGFSNGTLWPLYHDAIVPSEFHRDWWGHYVAVNQRFADAAARSAAPGATVWIHDYQLQLVPQMLRALRPDVAIGFFLHIPYPPQELFMRLPWRTELINGMLGADVVGFQVPVAAQNFAVLAKRLGGAKGNAQRLTVGERTVRVGAFPISIDIERYARLAADPQTIIGAKEVRERLGNPRIIILGVDRLDYTKGIEVRLKAYRELLQDGKVGTSDCTLVQIAVPSRSDVPAYGDERDRIERLVGEINGDYGEMGAPAVHYLHRNLSIAELVELYLAADLLLVTPYRDGMNLVAKEYVACRLDDTGSLVLSEFAGAARELSAASLVNPYDIAAVKEAIVSAMKASPRDVQRRMRAMRRAVDRWTVHDWAKVFIDTVTASTASVPEAPSDGGAAAVSAP